MTYMRREMAKPLRDVLEEFPVVVISGMRQAGKSTLLLNEPFLAGRDYINLDDFASLVEARDSPEEMLRQPGQLTIDEAQRAPDMLLAIKKLVDSKREPGRFLLSGSANFLLMEKISESLAGRALYLYLRPMNRRECQGSIRKEPFISRAFAEGGAKRQRDEASPVKDAEVLAGGLPPVCTGQIRQKEMWFAGYEETYVERDVRNLANVGDLMSFRRILRLVANRTGQLMNVSSLAIDAGTSVPTAKKYLSLLETSFLITIVPPYLSSRTTRLIKTPKVYFSDSGLAAHVAGVKTMTGDPFRGHLYETYCAQNLQSILEAHLPGARIYFWCVQGRHEVDFIIEVGAEIIAVEVKAATRFDPGDLAGLKAFLEVEPRCKAAFLAYNGTSMAKLGDKLWAVPIDTLLS